MKIYNKWSLKKNVLTISLYTVNIYLNEKNNHQTIFSFIVEIYKTSIKNIIMYFNLNNLIWKTFFNFKKKYKHTSRFEFSIISTKDGRKIYHNQKKNFF